MRGWPLTRQTLIAIRAKETVLRTNGLRPAWPVFVLATLIATLVAMVCGGSVLAATVSITSASFSGGANTAVVGGTLYAKNSATVTLTVNTSSNAQCVQVSGAHTGQQTSQNGQATWSFPFTAGSGPGAPRVHVVASATKN